MPESADVSKMKVADLKRELKIRGLSITGNKNELTERLQAALIDGELSLDDTGISGEDLDEDGVLTDEEEKILNENELLESPRLENPHINDLLHEKEITQANNASGSAKKIVLKRKISTNILSDIGTISGNIDDTLLTPSKILKTESANTIQPSIGADANVSAAVKKISQLSAQERLEMRAKKFGLKDAVDNKSITSSETTTVTKDVLGIEGEKEASLLKKRAERFGCVVSSKMVELDAADRLQKRKERFGGTTSTTAVTKAPIPDTKPTNDVWAEKARLRLERFKGAEAKTVNV